MGTFLFIPTVLSAALLPVFARMAQSDPESLQSAQRRVLTVLIICALPATVGVILMAHPLCLLLYGANQFRDLPLALQYAALTILPLYIVSIVYQFLVAQGRNGRWTMVLVGTLAINALLAWLLVPVTLRTLHNGIVGATVANVVAESIATVFAFIMLRVNPFMPDMLSRVMRGVVATAAMGLVIWMIREGIVRLLLAPWLAHILALAVPAACGLAVFVGLVFALRALPPQEQSLIVDTVKRRLHRA